MQCTREAVGGPRARYFLALSLIVIEWRSGSAISAEVLPGGRIFGE